MDDPLSHGTGNKDHQSNHAAERLNFMWPFHVSAQTPPPTTSDLYRVGIQQGLPFVGFGFLDNFIMIVAGESIETFLGASLVISTMAAAALGNTLSDVFGIGLVTVVVDYSATKMIKFSHLIADPPGMSSIGLQG